VIDCPQTEDHAAITLPALRLCSDYVTPLTPHWIETDRTALLADQLDQVDALRDVPGRRWALLTRTNGHERTRHGDDAKVAEVLTGQGYTVFGDNVKFSTQLYAGQGGEVPRGLERTPFVRIARQLLTAAGADLGEGAA
jgi:hypothetical protein